VKGAAKVVALSEIAEVRGGGKLKLTGRDFVADGFPAFGAGGMNGYLPVQEFDRPGIVLASTGTCGRCYLAPGAWTSLANTQVILPHPPVADTRFLWYQLNDPSRWPISGTAQPFIKPSDVKAHRVYLPPIEEQRRIASILDAADALRAKRRQALDKLDTLTQSIFIEMFGDPGSNPAGWPKVTIGQLGRVVTGKTPPGTKKDMFGDEVPFVTPGDLESSAPVARWLSLEGARNSRLVPAGSTLVCCIGATIGKVGEAPVESAFNQQINAVDWDRSLVQPEYGTRVMRFMRREIARRGASTTMPLLNKTDFSQVEVPLPPLELQTVFRDRVSSLHEVHTRSDYQSTKLESLFASLQHRAFRGEL